MKIEGPSKNVPFSSKPQGHKGQGRIEEGDMTTQSVCDHELDPFTIKAILGTTGKT